MVKKKSAAGRGSGKRYARRKPSRRNLGNPVDMQNKSMDASEGAMGAAVDPDSGIRLDDLIDAVESRQADAVAESAKPTESSESFDWPRKMKVMRMPLNRNLVLVDFGGGKELMVRVRDNISIRRGMEINVHRVEREGRYEYTCKDRFTGLPRRFV